MKARSGASTPPSTSGSHGPYDPLRASSTSNADPSRSSPHQPTRADERYWAATWRSPTSTPRSVSRAGVATSDWATAEPSGSPASSGPPGDRLDHHRAGDPRPMKPNASALSTKRCRKAPASAGARPGRDDRPTPPARVAQRPRSGPQRVRPASRGRTARRGAVLQRSNRSACQPLTSNAMHFSRMHVIGVIAGICRAVRNVHANEITQQLVVGADHFLVELSRHRWKALS
jgi:hypothetical protein